jgi:radical SAM protein with 4Fe4S-binding SPASM domain
MCNCRCAFCIRNNLQKQSEQKLSLKTLRDSVDFLSVAFPKSTLVITGGEPFLYKEWDKLVDYALEKFPSVVIPSNGTFDNEVRIKLQDFLKRNLFLQISLDGTKEIHDKIRGKGVFDSALQNLIALKEYASKIVLSTTVGVRNAGNVCDLAFFLNDYKFRHWKVSLEQVCSPGKDDEINYCDWNKLVDQILLKCAYEVHIKKQFDFELMDKAVGKEHLFKSINRNCGFCKNKIYIDTNLDVYPCSCIDLKVGNLKEDTVKSLKEKIDKLGNIAPSVDSPCFSCKYKKLCNGGCPGYSYKYFGSLNRGDIRCPIVKGSLK